MQFSTKQPLFFHWTFCLLLVGLPVSKAIVSIAFVGLLLIVTYRLVSKQSAPFPSILLAIPVILFCVLGLSLFYTTNLKEGWKTLISYSKLLAIPLIFWQGQTVIRKRFSFYLKILVASTTLAALLTLILFLLPSEITKNITANLPILKDYIQHQKTYAFGAYSPFIDRLQFSYLIAVSFFLQLWMGLRQKFSIPQLIILGILLTTLLILGARGAQISFLLASAVWLVYYFFFLVKKYSRSLLAYGILISTILMVIIAFPKLAYDYVPAVKMRYDQMLWEIGTFRDGTFRNYDYTHFTSLRRWLSWKNSWALICENPILGTGIGNYQTAMADVYQKDGLGFPVNTQSQFLYFWTAAGLLAFLAFLMLLLYPVYHLYKEKNSLFKGFSFAFLTFYLLIFLFDAPLNYQVGSLTFLIIYGFVAITPDTN
ncbi:MAG: O-antigen ligase family protein [Bacteroidota bacterium]